MQQNRRRIVCLCLAALCLLPLSMAHAEERLGFSKTVEPADMTAECELLLADDNINKTTLLTDGFVESYAPIAADSVVKIELARAASGIQLYWFDSPSEYQVIAYDAANIEISRERVANGFVNAYCALPQDAASVAVICSKDACLSEITVFDAAYPLPDSVQRWEQGEEETELLLVTATPETAVKNHYALLATLAVQQQITTRLLVMDCPTRAQQQALLDAVWALGIDQYPCFGYFTTTDANDMATVRSDWGREKSTGFLVAAIRRCKPLVVITDSQNGDFAGAAQRFLSQQVKEACESAKSAVRFSDSANAYGVFAVQKLYFADESGNTRLDPDAPLAVYSGQTLGQVVLRASQYHASCVSFAQTPNWTYRLESSTVGADANDGNVFLHIQRRQTTASDTIHRPLLADLPASECTTQDVADDAKTGISHQSCFRAAYDPAEYVAFDHEHGYYEYRSDTLSVIIDRYERETDAGQTLFLVAQIRMRDVDAFRALAEPDAKTMLPLQMARENRAVLLINADQAAANAGQKGILLQNGRVLSQGMGADTLAFYPDMTMRIFSPGETDAATLLSQGVRNTFSFGPTLIRNGVKNTDATLAATQRDARAGIGMLDTGSFVVIVTDGRGSQYSVGLRLDEFADLFEEFGCTQAYNLSGGRLTSLVFLGKQLTSVPQIVPDTGLRLRNALAWGWSKKASGTGNDIDSDDAPGK